jgi:hypothetical protein
MSKNSSATTCSSSSWTCSPIRRIDDDTFAEVALRGAKFLRAGATAAIAAGRPAPPGWTETAESRFEQGDWGERQLLLRALAESDGTVLPAVLANAEEDWSGSPLARAVSRFLEARVAAGELLTLAELEELDAGLQPLVCELIDGTDVTTRAVLRPALEQWQTTTIDIDFFRELGRIVDPVERPPATLVGSRIAAVAALVGALGAARPRSVLVVGDPGVGKTTLIVEALRRLGDDPVRVPGRRGRRECGPGVRRDARRTGAQDHGPPLAAADRLGFPEFRGGALVRSAHAEPARRAGCAPPPLRGR